jgi:hypothetical protein
VHEKLEYNTTEYSNQNIPHVFLNLTTVVEHKPYHLINGTVIIKRFTRRSKMNSMPKNINTIGFYIRKPLFVGSRLIWYQHHLGI